MTNECESVKVNDYDPECWKSTIPRQELNAALEIWRCCPASKKGARSKGTPKLW